MTTTELKYINSQLRNTLLKIFIPFAIGISGLFIADHFKVKEIEKYKVDKEYFHQKLYEYTLLNNEKVLILENLASQSKSDITEICEQLKTLDEINRKFENEINRLRVTRGQSQVQIVPPSGSGGGKVK